MIEVYVIYTGQTVRTTIPGSPFVNHQAAHTELFNFGVLQGGNWPGFLNLIDEYGFIIQGGNTISVPTKP